MRTPAQLGGLSLLALHLAIAPGAQIRVHERARYTAQADARYGETSQAWYDRTRGVITGLDAVTAYQLIPGREWFGPGDVGLAANAPALTNWAVGCPFPGRPGASLAMEVQPNGSASVIATWIYEAGTWRRFSTTPAPAPGTPSQVTRLALDETRERVVALCTSLGSTWEFDGTKWLEVGRLPAVTVWVQLTYYNATHRRVECLSEGGRIDSWDGRSWTSRLAAFDANLRPFAVGFDRARSRVVVSADRSAGGILEYDDRYRVYRPFAAITAEMIVYDEARRVCVVKDRQRTYLWNGRTTTDITPSTVRPAPRTDAMLAADATRGAILFGGRDQNHRPTNETWLWNGTAWANLALPNAPSARSAAAMSGGGNSVLLFGGLNADNHTLADTWACDAGGWRQIPTFVGHVPARRSHAMTTYYGSATPTVFMFGGTDGQSGFDDLRRLDYIPFLGGYWQWTLLPTAVRPAPRSGHAMVVDEARRKIVLFGGADEWLQILDDTWEWDLANGGWTQRSSPHTPPPRQEHGMAYDRLRGRTVLIGGHDGGHRNDIWEWDGTDWTQRDLDTAPIVATANMAIDFDPRTKRIVMFGGNDRAGLSDRTYEIFEWNGPAVRGQVAPLSLTVHRAPTVGAPLTTSLELSFPCSGNYGYIFLGPAPSPTPTYYGTPPDFCSRQEIYLPIASQMTTMGNPARFTLPVQSTMEGSYLCVQGAAVTAALCFDVTDTRMILVRSVR